LRRDPVQVGEARVGQSLPDALYRACIPTEEDVRDIGKLDRDRQGILRPLVEVDDDRVGRISG
jgi:hypothetical protein